MSRYLWVLGALMLLSPTSFGAPNKKVKSSTFKLEFGYTKDSSGVKSSLKGLKIPFTMEKVSSVVIKRKAKGTIKGNTVKDGLSLIDPFQKRMLFAYNLAGLTSMLPVAPFFDATVYMADSNTTYGIFEEDDPSALDDIQMAGGAGQPWKHLTIGFDVKEDPTIFLIRWRCYAGLSGNTNPGESAFNQEFADFGGYFLPSQVQGWAGPGTYKVTFNIVGGGADVVAPSNSIWVASQFRVPNLVGGVENGEGNFDTRIRNVYNNTAPPTVGTSENTFYYDWDPLDGLYSSNEIEQVSDGLSNLLFGILTGGTADVRNATSVTIPQGTMTSNPADSVDQAIDSDDWKVTGKPLYNVPRSIAPLQFVFQGTAANINAINFTFKVEASATSGGGSQVISLFNYVTNDWENVDTRAISTTDTVAQFSTVTNPTRFINQTTRQIRARLGFFPPLDASRAWEARVDQAQWRIIRP